MSTVTDLMLFSFLPLPIFLTDRGKNKARHKAKEREGEKSEKQCERKERQFPPLPFSLGPQLCQA